MEYRSQYTSAWIKNALHYNTTVMLFDISKQKILESLLLDGFYIYTARWYCISFDVIWNNAIYVPTANYNNIL